MNTLLIAAHGSRNPDSNQEIAELAQRLDASLTSRFDRVSHAFVQFTTPLIPDEIDTLVREGARTITVLPYFIAGGSHVTKDMPAIIERAKMAYPSVVINLTPHFGSFRGIPDLILSELAAVAG